MRFHLVAAISELKVKLRAIIGLGLVIGLLAALMLASAPRLHEQLHPGAQHECVVTIVVSGNCEHAASPAIAPALAHLPVSAAPLEHGVSFRGAPLPLSILEHAPPCAI